LGAPVTTGSSDVVAARAVEWVQQAFPNVKGVFCTTRYASDASQNRWGAIATWHGETVTIAEQAVAVYDRVGGGDSAAAAFLFGLLTERGLSWAARAAVTHGALTMSTPGDNSMVTLEDIEIAMSSEQVRMVR
jgi:2-dehydro-3-deoxygluconokinase